MITKEQTKEVREFCKKAKRPYKRDELARYLKLNPVKIRQAADECIKDGIPLVTNYKTGFFIAKKSSDIDEEERRTRKMGMTLLRKAKDLRKIRATMKYKEDKKAGLTLI